MSAERQTISHNQSVRFYASPRIYFDVELKGNELQVRCMDGTMAVIPDCSNVVKLRVLSAFVLEHQRKSENG